MGIQFTALEDFWSEEARSQYCAGLTYTVENDLMLKLVKQWLEEKKVVLGGPAAQLTGRG